MLAKLPLKQDLETKIILKKTITANKLLAELRGIIKIIPNNFILINALSLQEAKNSSEIENIITTRDDLYKAELKLTNISKESKEVKNYQSALFEGSKLIKNGILSINDIVKIQSIIEQNDAGIRTQTGAQLKNQRTGEIIYTPPQNYDDIIELLTNLEHYINKNNKLDTLINMAIIHYQFESIHPFYDGNGRTGRIINILYLMLNGLLDIPILYLSRYIIKNRNDYYRLLQGVRKDNNWQEWILYMLDSVEQIAKETIILVNKIDELMRKQKIIIKEQLPNIYSKDLLEVIFINPYSKINFLTDKLSITRQTASKYLQKLSDIGLMEPKKLSRSKYFINKELLQLLKDGV